MHPDVPARSGLRSRPPHLVLHHRHGFRPEPPQAVTRRGLPVVRLERALVDAWPLLPPRRAARAAGPTVRRLPTMYLDGYAERERVDFELDGATAHGDPRQREIDLRRAEVLAILASRRAD